MACTSTACRPRPGGPTSSPRSPPRGQAIIVPRGPPPALRVGGNQMNYAYLGDRLSTAAAENFPVFLADLCARAEGADVTPPTRSLLDRRPSHEHEFPTSKALLDY